MDCVALSVVACVFRFAYLDRASLWHDELFTVFWSKSDLGFLTGEGARIETIPPAYFVAMHAWMSVFGDSTFIVRLPSLVCSAATVLVTYSIGRVLFARHTALLAGLFVCVNATAVAYAQEARSYAALGLMNALALLALTLWAPTIGKSSENSWPALTLFAVATIAGVGLQYTSLLFVAACFAVILPDISQIPGPSGHLG